MANTQCSIIHPVFHAPNHWSVFGWTPLSTICLQRNDIERAPSELLEYSIHLNGRIQMRHLVPSHICAFIRRSTKQKCNSGSCTKQIIQQHWNGMNRSSQTKQPKKISMIYPWENLPLYRFKQSICSNVQCDVESAPAAGMLNGIQPHSALILSVRHLTMQLLRR